MNGITNNTIKLKMILYNVKPKIISRYDLSSTHHVNLNQYLHLFPHPAQLPPSLSQPQCGPNCCSSLAGENLFAAFGPA